MRVPLPWACKWYGVDTCILLGTKWTVTPAPSPKPSAGQSAGTFDEVKPGFSFQELEGVGLDGLLVGISVGVLTCDLASGKRSSRSTGNHRFGGEKTDYRTRF